MSENTETFKKKVSLQLLFLDLEDRFGFNPDDVVEIFYAGGFLSAVITKDAGRIETIRYIIVKDHLNVTKLFGFNHKTIKNVDFMRLVLNLMHAGISQREIARRTGVSKKTVDSTVKDINTLGVEVSGPRANYSFLLS